MERSAAMTVASTGIHAEHYRTILLRKSIRRAHVMFATHELSCWPDCPNCKQSMEEEAVGLERANVDKSNRFSSHRSPASEERP
eukprot:862960-Amphidinium_carterae.1